VVDATEHTITLAELEQYLHDNPDVFLTQPELLEIVELHASPEGTISLAQKQQARIQEKNLQLTEQLRLLVDNAHSNVALQQRVHQLCLKLLDATEMDTLFSTLMTELKQGFSADEVALRLFHEPVPQMGSFVSQMNVDAPELRCFETLLTKHQPVCGRLTQAQKQILFEERADDIESIACLPLGDTPCLGLLAIGSTDPNRFHGDMATDYLHFLGEVFVRAVRHLS
jgi:hypothetical protein